MTQIFWDTVPARESIEDFVEGLLVKIVNGVAWVIILVVRSIALWVIVPLAFVAFVLVHAWLQEASLRQVIAWYDLNFVALLANGPFRLFLIPSGRPFFLSLSKMAESDFYKIHFADFF